MRNLIPALLAVLAVAFSQTASAENSPATRLSLRGLPGVGVRIQPLSEDAQRLGISAERLEGLLRTRLKAADISLLSPVEQQRTAGRPGLSLHVAALSLENDEFLYSVHLDLRQWVALLANPDATLETALSVPATTWAPDYRFGIAPSDRVQEDLLTAVGHMVDEFVEAYRRANPMARPVP